MGYSRFSRTLDSPQAAQNQVEGVLLKRQELLVGQNPLGLDLTRPAEFLNIREQDGSGSGLHQFSQ